MKSKLDIYKFKNLLYTLRTKKAHGRKQCGGECLESYQRGVNQVYMGLSQRPTLKSQCWTIRNYDRGCLVSHMNVFTICLNLLFNQWVLVGWKCICDSIGSQKSTIVVIAYILTKGEATAMMAAPQLQATSNKIANDVLKSIYNKVGSQEILAVCNRSRVSHKSYIAIYKTSRTGIQYVLYIPN